MSPIVSTSAVDAAASARPAAEYFVMLGTFPNTPKFFAFNNALAPFNATPPGTPNCVKSSVTVPVHLSSAKSSNCLYKSILSKYFSTFAASLVPKPRSNNNAPVDTIPSAALNAPDPIPARPD